MNMIIKFEKGGEFKARLMSEKAPITVEKLVKALPFESKIMHARFKGMGIFAKIDLGDLPPENATLKHKFGELSMYLGGPMFTGQALHMWYGDKIASPEGSTKETFFAVIEDNLEELSEVGNRNWTEGPEKAYFSLEE